MAHRNLMIKRREGGRDRACRVAVDQDEIRLFPEKDRIEALQHPGGDIGQGLSRLHQVQVIIRTDGERAQHLIKHFPVLGRNTDDALYFRIGFHLLNQDGHFDGFRTGAEHTHHFNFFRF